MSGVSSSFPPRIAVVIHSLCGGGAERTATRLANHWCERTGSVALITLDTRETDVYRVDDRVTRIGLDVMGHSASRWQAIRNNARRLLILRRAIATSGATTIVSLTEKMNVTVALACAGMRRDIVLCERTDPRHHSIGRWWDWARRRTYPRGRCLVVQTEGVRTWGRALMHGRPVYAIPNAAFETPAARCTRTAMEGTVRRILGLGRLADHKGFDLLIAAFGRVAHRHPEWILEIHGEGDQRRELERLRDAEGLANRVLLPGWTRDSQEVLAQGDFFVLPSRYEGFPNALLEAMAAGLPCISFDCESGPREIIRHDVDGVLVPPEDVASLADAMDRFMSDPVLRQRLGARAAEVPDRFSAVRFFLQWDAVLRGSPESEVDALRAPITPPVH